MGLSNLDLAVFVPVGCLAPTTTFYDLLVLKTVAPLGAVTLMWTPAAVKYIARKDSAPAARTAARWSFFLMELIVSSDDYYLSAQLTLACDGSEQRRHYLGYAVFFMLVYPVGKPPPALIHGGHDVMLVVCDKGR